MAIDIKAEMRRKADQKQIDEMVKELMRDPLMVPSQIQLLDRCYRPYKQVLQGAYERGDDVHRFLGAVAALSADMVLDFLMRTIPNSQPEMVVRVAQSYTDMFGQVLNEGLTAYIGQPAPAPQPAPANDG
jgi:hypothetical protein